MTLNVLIGNGSWYPVISSSGPTLVTAPTISAFFPSSAISGEVLTATAATWQEEEGVVLTGTVGAGDLISRSGVDVVFYIGSNPNTSSTTDEYQYWYLFVDGVFPYVASGLDSAYCGIKSYDGSTKRVTVEWQVSGTPTVGGTWKLVKNYPVLRKGQWKRNGVAIADQESRAYTTTAADVGQSLTYEETAGFTDWTWRQNPLSYSVPPLPSTSTTTISAPYISSASFTSTNRINSASDFSYLGSFRCPGGKQNLKLSLVPPSQSFNGQVSLMLTEGGASEFNIPGLLTNPDPSLLNLAVATRSSASNIYDDWYLPSKNGIVNGGITGGVSAVSGTSNIFASVAPWYSNQNNNIFVKRSADISSSGALTPFFVYASQSSINKWASGSIVEIPAALQSSLGGDYLVSSGLTAVAGANSNAPGGRVFNSTDVDSAIANFTSGVTTANGSSTTAVLAVGSSGTPDFYQNWQIVFTVGANVRIANISGYNSSSRVVTFNDIGLSVVSGSSYSLIAPVVGKQLYGRSSPYEPDTKALPSLWNTAGGSFNFSSFIPRGTTSVVNITNSWIGINSYGLWAPYPSPGPGNNGRAWGGITGGRRLYLDGIAADASPGPRQGSIWGNGLSNPCCFWVYDSSDLADVVSGSQTYDQINPRAVFTMQLPYGGLSAPYSAAFDNVNNRLYIYQYLWVRSKNTSYHLVHVYSCSKYV
jgi:hypothetical protein